MPRFQWTKEHAVYVPELDAQHRNLYRLADELQRAIRAGAGMTPVLELLRALVAAAAEHFEFEERLMRSTAYGAYFWHAQQHETARKRIAAMVPRIESGEKEAGPELLAFLGGWLGDHTSVTDRMLGAHLRNHDRLQLAS